MLVLKHLGLLLKLGCVLDGTGAMLIAARIKFFQCLHLGACRSFAKGQSRLCTTANCSLNPKQLSQAFARLQGWKP